MADPNQAQQQQHSTLNGFGEVVETVIPTIQLSHSSEDGQSQVEQVSEDLLQQALGVAVSNFNQEAIKYTTTGDGVVSVHHIDGTETMVVNVDGEDVATLVDQVEDVDPEQFQEGEYVEMAEAVSVEQMEELSNTAQELCENAIIVNEPNEEGTVQTADDDNKKMTDLDNQQFSLVSNDSTKESAPLRVTLMPTNASSGAPLGSSQNPIRIIQQGNQYTPVQQLSTDQLSQIMQVVQQQQVARAAEEGDGMSTMFNPDTNTRIVYRVIYPSELHKSSSTDSNVLTQTQGQQTGSLQRRVNKKRRLEDDEDKAVDVPELSREEKEARKKHRPRTRSGRVSKPPKHMIKDYKHIHPVDWDEDPYDDSDGGYSDFKYSEDERERGNQENEDSNDVYYTAGMGNMKPKKWKCSTCEKSYIGRGGLGRHYRLNPDHEKGDNSTDAVKSPTVSNGLGFSGIISENNIKQDVLPTTSTASLTTASTANSKPVRPYTKTAPRGPNSSYKAASGKRKSKLKELIRLYSNEELMEVVLPRLSKVITLWEFLLMKVEKGKPSRPDVTSIFNEFSTLHKKVENLCQKYFQPWSDDLKLDHSQKIQIENEAVAQSLGLDVGDYCAKPIDITDPSFHQQFPVTPAITVSTPANKTVNLVTAEELLSQGNKRIVINPPSTMATGQGGLPIIKLATSPISAEKTMSPKIVKSTPDLIAATGVSPVSKPAMTSQANSRPQESLLRQAFRLVSPTRPPGQGTIMSSNTTSLLRTPSINSTNKTNVASSVLTSKQLHLSTSTPSSMYASHTSVPISSQSHSTQVTVPVMLPQGTEQISLELPSSLAQTLVNNTDISQSVTCTTTSLPASGITPILVNSGGSAINNQFGETIQSIATTSSEDNGQSHILKVEGLGEVHLPAHIDSNNITQFVQHEGEITALTNGTETMAEDQLEEGQVIAGSNIYQTEDGIVIIENPDGTTLQLQGAQGLSLETIQALLSMDTSSGNVLQISDPQEGESVLEITGQSDDGVIQMSETLAHLGSQQHHSVLQVSEQSGQIVEPEQSVLQVHTQDGQSVMQIIDGQSVLQFTE